MKRAVFVLCAIYFALGGVMILYEVFAGPPEAKLAALLYGVVAVGGIAGSVLGYRAPSSSMFTLTAVALGLYMPYVVLSGQPFASPAPVSCPFWFSTSVTRSGAPVFALGLDFIPFALLLLLAWSHRSFLSPKGKDNIDQLTAILSTTVVVSVVGGMMFGLGGFLLGFLIGVLAGTLVSGAVVGLRRRRRARAAEREGVASVSQPAPAEPSEPES